MSETKIVVDYLLAVQDIYCYVLYSSSNLLHDVSLLSSQCISNPRNRQQQTTYHVVSITL